MAVINKYTAHTIEPDILSRLNVDQAGDVVSAETWVALWELVLHLLGKYNEHFVDIYRTLGELGEELDICVERVDTLEGQYQGLVDRMGNLETSWSALQEAYNNVAGCYDEIKQIQNTLESGFVHYGEEPPASAFIKLWVMPTQGVPSLITSWGENDILATNYNYASAKLIKDTLNTKVNKAGDTITGPIIFNAGLATHLQDINNRWHINFNGDSKFNHTVVDAIRIYTDDDTAHDIVFGKSHGSHVVGASLGGHRIRNVGAPTEDTDAATKEYADTALAQAKEYSDTHQDLNDAVDADILNWESGKVYKTTAIKGQAIKCGTHTSEEKYDSGVAVVFKSTQENNEVSVILIALGVSSNLWCNYTVFYEGTTIRTVYPEKESNYGLTQTLVGADDPFGDGAIKYPSAKAVKLTIDALLDSFYDHVSKNIEPKLVSCNPSIVLTEWDPDRVYRTGSIAGKTIYLQNTYLVDYTMPDGIAWVQNISETSTERNLRVYVLSSEGNAIINLFYNPTEPNNVAYHKYSVALHDIARPEDVFKYEPFEKEYTELNLNYILEDTGQMLVDNVYPLEQDFDYTKYEFEVLYANHCPDNVVTVEYTTASDPVPKRMTLDVVDPWEHDYCLGNDEYEAYQYPDAQTVLTGLVFSFHTYTEDPFALCLTSVFLPDNHDYTSLKIINAHTRVRYKNEISSDRVHFKLNAIPPSALQGNIPISKLQPLKGNATVLQKAMLPESTEEPVSVVSLSLPKRDYAVYTCLGSFKLADTTAVPDCFNFFVHFNTPTSSWYPNEQIKLQPSARTSSLKLAWRMECVREDVYHCSLSLLDDSNDVHDTVEYFIDLTARYEFDSWSLSFDIRDEDGNRMGISAAINASSLSHIKEDTLKGIVLYGSKC